MSERFLEDPGVPAVLAALGVPSDARLGCGGEASVYALDASRVLRIHRAGTSVASVDRRAALLAELQPSASRLPFKIPRVLERRLVADRVVTVEPRLPGRPLSDVLAASSGPERAALIEAYLAAAARLAELAIERPFFGDLLADDPLRCVTFREYLIARARESLRRCGDELAALDVEALCAPLPEPERPEFVYLDVYPGNLLVEGDTVTAVTDFGGVAFIGDGRFNVLAAASYLPLEDEPVVRRFLDERGSFELFGPVRRWVAAFWAFAADDPVLHAWCRSVLIAPVESPR